MSSINTAKRQLALEKELAQLTNVNSTIDSLLESIQKSQININKTKQSTDHTSKLLEDWIRILSQTEFTNQILNNPKWDGKFSKMKENNENDENDDYDEEIEITNKFNQEQKLINELNNLENENNQLLDEIELKEEQDRLSQAKLNELQNKRKRELGLGLGYKSNKRGVNRRND